VLASQPGLTLHAWSYLFGESIPLLVSNFILGNIIHLGEDEAEDGENVDCDEDPVPLWVQRLIFGLVYLRSNDATKLDEHYCQESQRETLVIEVGGGDLLLYKAVDTLREPTLFEFLEAQPTKVYD
jgi:hypothetical protein